MPTMSSTRPAVELSTAERRGAFWRAIAAGLVAASLMALALVTAAG